MARRRRTRVIVAGAGLAGLTAARSLERLGVDVTIVEARDRIGGRVHTLRSGFAAGQHVEAGADLIEAEQTHVLALARELKLDTVRILRTGWGFYGSSRSGRQKIHNAPRRFEHAAELLQPEIQAYKAADCRWDSAVAQWIGRQSVAEWLTRARADVDLAATIRGLRGFFLADAEDLSLLPVVDQFAEEEFPGAGAIYRLRAGNDALPAAMARELRGRLLTKTILREVTRTRSTIRAKVENGGLQELTADYLVMALPASTLRDVRIRPALPDDQQRAIATLRYGAATRVALQFESRFWKRIARPSAYGTDQPFGAVWDGNEQQGRTPGILTILAGGSASRDVRRIIADGGWPALVRKLSWLGRPSTLLNAVTYTWERDRWARGGYAVFDRRFDPALRAWLARPHGRIVFAGEHTSGKFEGFMNGAVESGRRAAIEVAVMAGLDYARLQ